MIVTRIYGGLGNQMFQYAAGRALSLAHHEKFGLDTHEFAAYALHQGFELTRVFGLKTPQLSQAQLRQSFGWRVFPLTQRIAARWPYFPLADQRMVLEPFLDYWPGMADVPAHAYLRGYWQSDRYFQACADSIRGDFQFKDPLQGQALAWAEHMQSVTSVSLHIRRGDYVANPATLAYHGICSPDYYRQAVDAIAAQVNHPEFFVFSDDLQWARENLKLPYPVHYVEGNLGAASYRDMQLMSLCSHHIIANSSFSWWGAWLNARADKKVMAPARWFAAKPSPKGLYPEAWTVLS